MDFNSRIDIFARGEKKKKHKQIKFILNTKCFMLLFCVCRWGWKDERMGERIEGERDKVFYVNLWLPLILWANIFNACVFMLHFSELFQEPNFFRSSFLLMLESGSEIDLTIQTFFLGKKEDFENETDEFWWLDAWCTDQSSKRVWSFYELFLEELLSENLLNEVFL